jgi:SAM-dependent methyltransferase
MMYEQILNDLRTAYDRKADERDQYETSEWKQQERLRFLSLLREEGKHLLLDIGAGTGIHGKFFKDQGMEVVCTDLSLENVRRCREKGLAAYVMDFLRLGFDDETFDAIFAMNCLLHVPKSDLPRVLESLQRKLIIGGLFYWGQYGGVERQGFWPDDDYEPKRFYSLLLDDQMQTISESYFEVISSHIIDTETEDDIHFHSVILRRGLSSR